jgi:peptidoglycan/xylan/chitin deacetylase (PgdA/CDA1 family)
VVDRRLRGVSRLALQRWVKLAAAGADRVQRRSNGVVVLAYHRVGCRSTAGEIDLPRDVFAAQMASIASRATTLDDALDSLVLGGRPKGDIVVTFDDGTVDFLDEALPVLVQYAIPAVLFAATQHIDEARPFPQDGRPLTWSALREAASTGLVTIGSHTHSHALLDRSDGATAADELDRSIDLIGEHLGLRPDHFAYPKALPGNREAADEVARRFRSAALAGTRPNRLGETDPLRLARSPIQRSDGMRWFERKVDGGMMLEDAMRRAANRVRYVGATS